MKLTDLRVRNFRCFEDLLLRFDDHLTVLVANNGNGKTTILDAIAIAFGPFLTRLPKVKGKDFGANDLRIKEDGKPAPFHSISARVYVEKEWIEWTRFAKRDQSRWTEIETEREIQAEQDKLNSENCYDPSQARNNRLGVVMDLASRMAEANPHMGVDSLESAGVVLIDEIDMHLHPEWQQHIIQDLQRTFPNLQFICTTHSPQVLSTIPKKASC